MLCHIHDRNAISQNAKQDITDVDEALATEIAKQICTDDDEDDPTSYNEAKRSTNWLKWKEAMKAEYDSLRKRGVFGPPEEAPLNKTTVGNKWVYVRKRDEKGCVTRYHGRLVAQGFTQRYGFDFKETAF